MWIGNARLSQQLRQVATLNERMSEMAIDTSRILAEVARERTELASWKAMSAAKDKLIADQADALRKAMEANDPVAMAQVQTDLDKAAADLAADNDDADAAIKAMPPPDHPPPTPGP